MTPSELRGVRARLRAWAAPRLRLLGLRGVALVKRRVLRPLAGGLLGSPATAGLRMRAASMRPAGVVRIVDRLDAAGVAAWVGGGWGVDALVGHQTRRHTDLDLLLDRADEERAVSELAAMGYGTLTSEPVSDSLTPWRIAVYDALGRSVDLHPVDLERWLTTVVAPALPGAEDPAAAAFAEGRISGRRVRCLSAALQTLAHRGYAGREADHHDLRLLAQLGAAGRAST